MVLWVEPIFGQEHLRAKENVVGHDSDNYSWKYEPVTDWDHETTHEIGHLQTHGK